MFAPAGAGADEADAAEATEPVADSPAPDRMSNPVEWLRQQLRELQAMGLSGSGADDRRSRVSLDA